MADLGQLLFSVRANLADLDKDLDEAKGKGSKAGEEMGDAVTTGADSKLKTLGGKLNKTLTPAAAAVAAGATVISQSWNDGQRSMAAATGATGDRLDSLMGSVQNVAGSVKGGVGLISSTMAELAAKTDLTGKPLEDLTRRVLGLAEMGIQVSAADVGGAFGRWAVPTDEWGSSLERVFKVAQATGQTVPVLLGRLNEFAPVLQGLGFSFDQATVQVGKLSDKALGGLKFALDEIVKTGTTDVPGAFAAMIAGIQSAESPTAGMALAIETFGAKAGPELYAAISQGKFGVEELTAEVDGMTTTIGSTVEGNRTWLDQLGLLKDWAAAQAGPIAEKVSMIAGGVAAIGPAASGIGTAVNWVRGLGVAAGAAALGQTAMAAANVTEGTTAGIAAVPTMGLAAAIWAVAWPVLAVLAAIGLLIAAFLILTRVFGVDTVTAIEILMSVLFPFLAIPILIVENWSSIVGFFGDILGKVGDFFVGLKDRAVEAWDWIYKKVSEVAGFILGLPGKLADLGERIFGGIIGWAKQVIEWARKAGDALGDIAKKAAGGLFKMTPIGFALDKFADGGYVGGPKGKPRPIMAHGGEYVMSLDDLANSQPSLPGVGVTRAWDATDSAVALSGGERSSGGGDVYVTVEGSVVTERKLVATITAAQGTGRRRGQL